MSLKESRERQARLLDEEKRDPYFVHCLESLNPRSSGRLQGLYEEPPVMGWAWVVAMIVLGALGLAVCVVIWRMS
jgi:hypothetical protein